MYRRGLSAVNLVAAIVVVAALAFVTAGCGADTPEAGGQGAASGEPALSGLVRTDPLQVGHVSLPDVTEGATGERFEMKARPGHLLAVFFGFTTCPDICPTTLADLRTAREAVGPAGERVDLAMVTVDPERDTPEVMNGYLSSFADSFFALRTDDPDELLLAEEAFGARSEITTDPEGRVEVAHTATVFVVDENGVVLVEWPFGTPPEAIAADLEILLGEVRA